MHDICCRLKLGSSFRPAYLLKPLLKNVAVVSNGGTSCAAFPLKHFFTTCGCRSQADLPTRAVVLKPLFRRVLTRQDPMFLLVETRGLRGVPVNSRMSSLLQSLLAAGVFAAVHQCGCQRPPSKEPSVQLVGRHPQVAKIVEGVGVDPPGVLKIQILGSTCGVRQW